MWRNKRLNWKANRGGDIWRERSDETVGRNEREEGKYGGKDGRRRRMKRKET
jgi:hypothetical protein